MISLDSLFAAPIEIEQNIVLQNDSRNDALNQTQTKDIFSDKWKQVEQMDSLPKLYETQLEWFLKYYGFANEPALKDYLADKSVIIDAGCGLGYKAAWFARLAPHAIVIGIDISDAAYQAAANFRDLPNLYFMKGDIAKTGLAADSVDLVVCDQVIMHTEKPDVTFRHLTDITKPGGEFACYVYAKKALPRELVDDHFRTETHDVSAEEMWAMSEQLTELGKRLAELNVSFEAPDIPLLGIKGGIYDIQRFIHWNFIKCFWNKDWGFEISKATNYDWYAPSNAKRYSRDEFEQMIRENQLVISYFHQDEACYSGRFAK